MPTAIWGGSSSPFQDRRCERCTYISKHIFWDTSCEIAVTWNCLYRSGCLGTINVCVCVLMLCAGRAGVTMCISMTCVCKTGVTGCACVCINDVHAEQKYLRVYINNTCINSVFINIR